MNKGSNKYEQEPYLMLSSEDLEKDPSSELNPKTIIVNRMSLDFNDD